MAKERTDPHWTACGRVPIGSRKCSELHGRSGYPFQAVRTISPASSVFSWPHKYGPDKVVDLSIRNCASDSGALAWASSKR